MTPTQQLVEAQEAFRRVCEERDQLRAELADCGHAERERIRQLEHRNAHLKALLVTIISRFHEAGHPGYPALRSGWERVETVKDWRQQIEAEFDHCPGCAHRYGTCRDCPCCATVPGPVDTATSQKRTD